ncbi:MAG TPA: GAF domain-containing protein, partial [Candidatus Dormibacteraeota bacterium]|nr:GAF domain-containing protein [Candidatus Dormibacteraeota bacterium]
MLGEELPEAARGDADAISGAVTGVTDVGTALDRAAAAIAARIGWPVGHAYVAGNDGTAIPRRDWYLTDPRRFGPFRDVSTAETPVGGGMPARVIASGSPEWVVDMGRSASFLRRRAATLARISGGAGLPVVVDGRAAGVLEFFTDEPGAAEDGATRLRLIELAGRVGVELGEERATREIAGRRRVVGAVIDGPVAFATLDDELRLVDVNAAMARLAGRSPSELDRTPLASLDAEPGLPLADRIALRLASAPDALVPALLRAGTGEIRAHIHVWHAPGPGVAFAATIEPDV